MQRQHPDYQTTVLVWALNSTQSKSTLIAICTPSFVTWSRTLSSQCNMQNKCLVLGKAARIAFTNAASLSDPVSIPSSFTSYTCKLLSSTPRRYMQKFRQVSNLSSAIVIWVVSVVKMLSFSGGSASVILALPIHICWIDKINQSVLTVTVH